MKVILTKTEEVEFNLPEDKCKKVDHELFRYLTEFKSKDVTSSEPKMVAFKTTDEYRENADKYDLDLTKDVLINSKGNIFCYLQGECAKEVETDSETNTDVTANSEENQAE